MHKTNVKKVSYARKYAELKELLQRVQADFENAMKRKEKEIQLREQNARAEVLASFLPILDSIEEALKNSPEDRGMQLLKEQMLHAFRQNGVSEVKVHEAFDPNVMECVMRVDDPRKKNNAVLEVFQKGYKFHNSVLRPAKVKINIHEKVAEGDADG